MIRDTYGKAGATTTWGLTARLFDRHRVRLDCAPGKRGIRGAVLVLPQQSHLRRHPWFCRSRDRPPLHGQSPMAGILGCAHRRCVIADPLLLYGVLARFRIHIHGGALRCVPTARVVPLFCEALFSRMIGK